MKANKSVLISILAVAIVSFVALMLMNKKEETAPVAKTSAEEFLVRPHSPVKGNPDAKVTIVEFLDPECEACRAMHPIVKRLLTEYDGKVKLVIRYMPLHGNSKYAAAALEEARSLGKFDPALDILFDRQHEWGNHGQPRPELIPTYLKEIGVELPAMAELIAKHGAIVDMDAADGAKLGVRLTPTFFVNGVELPDIGYEPVKQAIEIALSK